MSKLLQKFFVTPYGTWAKTFIAAVLGQILISLVQGHSLFTWDKPMLEKVLTAGAVSVLPVIIAWVNPKDPRYGVNKTQPTNETTN